MIIYFHLACLLLVWVDVYALSVGKDKFIRVSMVDIRCCYLSPSWFIAFWLSSLLKYNAPSSNNNKKLFHSNETSLEMNVSYPLECFSFYGLMILCRILDSSQSCADDLAWSGRSYVSSLWNLGIATNFFKGLKFRNFVAGNQIILWVGI